MNQFNPGSIVHSACLYSIIVTPSTMQRLALFFVMAVWSFQNSIRYLYVVDGYQRLCN